MMTVLQALWMQKTVMGIIGTAEQRASGITTYNLNTTYFSHGIQHHQKVRELSVRGPGNESNTQLAMGTECKWVSRILRMPCSCTKRQLVEDPNEQQKRLQIPMG